MCWRRASTFRLTVIVAYVTELSLSADHCSCVQGIIFSVRPPKKSWKNITQLSGGEKTLSSLALVFALHHFKPTPLYFMDEIDAALDFKNVSIVAHYVKEQTKCAPATLCISCFRIGSCCLRSFVFAGMHSLL